MSSKRTKPEEPVKRYAHSPFDAVLTGSPVVRMPNALLPESSIERDVPVKERKSSSTRMDDGSCLRISILNLDNPPATELSLRLTAGFTLHKLDMIEDAISILREWESELSALPTGKFCAVRKKLRKK